MKDRLLGYGPLVLYALGLLVLAYAFPKGERLQNASKIWGSIILVVVGTSWWFGGKPSFGPRHSSKDDMSFVEDDKKK